MQLTGDQARAVAADEGANVFIEAHPGSGKTTVAAGRFGYLRYSPCRSRDARPVVATSFTRAATRELRVRIRRQWGRRALAAGHRVVTIDSLLRESVDWLIRRGHVEWPGEFDALVVRDSWRGAVETDSTRRRFTVALRAGVIAVIPSWVEAFAQMPTEDTFERAIASGICTHDEIRSVMWDALHDPTLAALLRGRFAQTMRALVVDEVFDANALDCAFVAACLEAGVAVTLVGDPWQALYEFRGARPDLVRTLAASGAFEEISLAQSFRWVSDAQRSLTERLRGSLDVELPQAPEPDHGFIDVALAQRWKHLWESSADILPLAFGSARHDLAYAGSTLVLNVICRSRVGVEATFLRDARITLGLNTPELVGEADHWAEGMARELVDGLTPRESYSKLCEGLRELTGREPLPYHWTRAQYFKWLMRHLHHAGGCLPGLSVHQAKGREWDNVAVVCGTDESEALRAGLLVTNARHRAIYVALTRARVGTYLLPKA